MIRSHDSQSAFDRWLDATLAGESTPADVAIDADPDATLRSTAHQVHALLRSADRDEGVTGRLDSIWENLDMHASPSASRMGAMTGAGAPPSRRGLPPVSRHRHTANAINLVLTAVLILGLGFGAWQTWSTWNTNGGGDPQPTAELAALQPEASPDTGYGVYGTPIDVNLIAPTAEECMVEPMTVDEVMAALDGVGINDQVMPDGSLDMTGSGVDPADFTVGPPSQQTFDQIVAVQREWRACIIAGDWMRVLALMHPQWIQTHLPDLAFPLFRSRDEAVAILQSIAETGRTREGLAPGDVFGTTNLVVPDREKALQSGLNVVTPAMTWSRSDGGQPTTFDVTGPDTAAVYLLWSGPDPGWRVWARPFPQG
jgi:hypothetical protein